MRSLSTVCTLMLAVASLASGQDASPFRALELPAPNMYQTGSGRPGPHYWQQRVDYTIAATLDAARNRLHGRETITYTNNSPDTLEYLWFHVEQNICSAGSITNKLNQPPLVFGASTLDFSCRGFAGGDSVETVTSGGRDLPTMLDGTTMRVELPGPLAPGGRIAIDVGWSFRIPEYGAGRMGRDAQLFEIAQWYPRVAVYDDVRGWNHEPYIGAGEFYLEYGSFDVALSEDCGSACSALTTAARARSARVRQRSLPRSVRR